MCLRHSIQSILHVTVCLTLCSYVLVAHYVDSDDIGITAAALMLSHCVYIESVSRQRVR